MNFKKIISFGTGLATLIGLTSLSQATTTEHVAIPKANESAVIISIDKDTPVFLEPFKIDGDDVTFETAYHYSHSSHSSHSSHRSHYSHYSSRY